MRVCDNGTFRDATIAEMDEAAKAQAEEEAAELNREPTPEDKFWANRIRQGKATIEDVPERWREEVRALLG